MAERNKTGRATAAPDGYDALDVFDPKWKAPEYYNLWVSHQERYRDGEPRRVVVASGPAAEYFCDLLLKIVRKHCRKRDDHRAAAEAEIRNIFRDA